MNNSHTFESVWATLDRVGDRLDRVGEKLDRVADRQAETDRQIKENSRILTEKLAETDRILTEKQSETDRQIKKVNETFGSWSYNYGRFAEEYFFNSFAKGKQNFFGEKFDEIKKNLKGTETDDEFDIVMLNGHSVGLVEVKFKAHENDVPKVLKKVNTFRTNFPKYKNHRVYLGLATMSFYPELEEECIHQGIAVIKQVGDTVIINEEHLKAF